MSLSRSSWPGSIVMLLALQEQGWPAPRRGCDPTRGSVDPLGRNGSSGRILRGISMSQRPEVIHSDPEILGGTPVFVGTRVPFRNLIDYLEHGHSLDEFLDEFPSVSREQAVAALEAAHEALSAGARSARSAAAASSSTRAHWASGSHGAGARL